MAGWDRCKEQWRLVYVQGLRRPPAGVAVLGGADHEAISENFAEKLKTGADMPVEQVQDRFSDAWGKRIENEGGLASIDWAKGEKLSKKAMQSEAGRLKDLGVGMVTAYRQQVSPIVNPIAVETFFELEVPDLPVKVHGYIDVEVAPLAMANRIIDRKSGDRIESKMKPDWARQGSVYQLARPHSIFEMHQTTRAKVPRIDTQLSQPAPSEAELQRLLLQMRMMVAEVGLMWRAFGPDHPWPDGKGHTWACSYCGFRERECWWWA